ncbi:type VII secretion-associated serine protease mycosin [Micromonospora sp. NPDC005707]|uniref:type VII secretion-associated serine protease mycosin n=1 Tax=Micromonospora sp. NPDC005707 TaxID=3157050 RepID=UPI0033E3D5D9
MVPPSLRSDPIRSAEWHLSYLKADQAQTYSKGAGVIVALPDTGISLHPDLRNNVLPGLDTTDEDDGDGRHDVDGHGTGMAGLIAAHGRPSSRGVLGIAPEAKLLPIRGKEKSEGGDTKDLAAGIDFAVSHGADVISISAAAGADVELQQAIRTALQADVVIVAAAGNTTASSTVEYPASDTDVIAVGGIDRNGDHAAISVSGPEIDVVAPAVDIYSTGINGGYRVGTGTSDATAIVAGAAALIRSRYPNLPAQEVAHRLTATAIDKGPPGRDDEYGYGVIDLVAALTADVPPLGFETPSVTAPPAAGNGNGNGNGNDDNSTARGLVTLGVLLAAGGLYLAWRRRRRGDDPPPRISR